jgi:hypothetical protein
VTTKNVSKHWQRQPWLCLPYSSDVGEKNDRRCDVCLSDTSVVKCRSQ